MQLSETGLAPWRSCGGWAAQLRCRSPLRPKEPSNASVWEQIYSGERTLRRGSCGQGREPRQSPPHLQKARPAPGLRVLLAATLRRPRSEPTERLLGGSAAGGHKRNCKLHNSSGPRRFLEQASVQLLSGDQQQQLPVQQLDELRK